MALVAGGSLLHGWHSGRWRFPDAVATVFVVIEDGRSLLVCRPPSTCPRRCRGHFLEKDPYTRRYLCVYCAPRGAEVAPLAVRMLSHGLYTGGADNGQKTSS
jgi:hypothetical protein